MLSDLVLKTLYMALTVCVSRLTNQLLFVVLTIQPKQELVLQDWI